MVFVLILTERFGMKSFAGTAPTTNDITMSRTTKNYLAGLDLDSRVRRMDFVKTLPKKYQDIVLDFMESDPNLSTVMCYILNAKETDTEAV